MSNKYEWLILTVADMGYPMEIRSGAFYDENGEDIAGIPIEKTLSSQWWSGDSGVVIAGEQFRPIPAKMSISWFSYAEDKFYEGTFILDKPKLESIFSKGLDCGNIDMVTRDFKIALAPGGQVFLYLTSPNTQLVGVYQAREYEVSDFKKEMRYPDYIDVTRSQVVNDFKKLMPLQTQQEIAEKRISMHIWKDINLRYPWKYTADLAEHNNLNLTLLSKDQGITFISGEDNWCLKSTDYLTENSPKPIPLEIDGKFETPAGRKFTIRIYPGNVAGVEPQKQAYEIRRAREQELVKLFKDFYEKIGNKEFEIHLKISENFKVGKLYLKKGKIEQEVPNVQVDIFDLTFGK
ncbi:MULTISPECIES: DUF2931 family protein [Chryseobacterium group]|uniref:DUF2931 family protein n=1 Tax=Chryseobacterium group TaxID=2782232 RepID=UPI001E4F3229|nr:MULTISPECIES: DUF2931 family protein [Chryseobacterium group]